MANLRCWMLMLLMGIATAADVETKWQNPLKTLPEELEKDNDDWSQQLERALHGNNVEHDSGNAFFQNDLDNIPPEDQDDGMEEVLNDNTQDDCDFEDRKKPYCNWSPLPAGLQWTRHKGETPSQFTGPEGDHTKNGAGHYIYMEGSNTIYNQKAKLISRPLAPKSKCCMYFFYSMYGTAVNTLSVYLVPPGSPNNKAKTIWTRSGGRKSPYWVEAKVDCQSTKRYQIIVEASAGFDFRSDIAVDDITIKDEACPVPTVVTTPVPSTASPTTKLPTTKKLSTKEPSTQPTTNQQSTKEPSTGATTNQPSTKNPSTRATTNQPVTKEPSTGATTNQPSTRELSTRPKSNQPTKGPSTKLTTKKPSSKPTTAKPVSPTTKAVKPFKDVLSCSFDQGFCNWTQANTSSYGWRRRNRQYLRPWRIKIGPAGDRTSEKGFYLFGLIYSRIWKLRDKNFTISSPEFTMDDTHRCMEFYVNMFGNRVGKLFVRLDNVDNNSTKIVYEQERSVFPAWDSGYFELGPSYAGKRLKVHITLASQGSEISFAAIDDIRMVNGQCPPPLQIPSTTSLQCLLNTGFCAWEQMIFDDLDWSMKIRRGRGYYGYIKRTYRSIKGGNAVLRSAVVSSSIPSCMSISARVLGQRQQSLDIWIVNENLRKEKLVFHRRGSRDRRWLTVKIDLPVKQAFFVEIIGKIRREYYGEVAIKRIMVSHEACS